MLNEDLLQFTPTKVTRTKFVNTLLTFAGLPYNPTTTVVKWAAAGTWTPEASGSGYWRGHGNCFGVLLLAGKLLGIVHPRLNIDLPPMMFFNRAEAAEKPNILQAKVLTRIIELNFDPVPFPAMTLGDILLMRYRDVDPSLNEPHHVGACVSESPLRLLHASQGAGKVCVCGLNELFARRIDDGDDRVLRCRNVIDG